MDTNFPGELALMPYGATNRAEGIQRPAGLLDYRCRLAGNLVGSLNRQNCRREGVENVSEVRNLVALQHIDERSQLVVERDFLAKAFELVSISRASFCRRPAGESEENLALMQLFDETDDHRQTRTDQGL